MLVHRSWNCPFLWPSELVRCFACTTSRAPLHRHSRPISGASVTLGLGPDATSATTDAAGVARATFDTTGLRGTYALTADHSGDGVFLPSQAESTVEVVRLASTITFDPSTTSQAEVGDTVVADIDLVDSQEVSPSGAAVTITFAGTSIDALTDEAGRATAEFTTDNLSAGSHALTATFDGDDRREPASAATSVSLAVPEPTFLASASRTLKGVTLHASASDVADETVSVTFAPEHFMDERQGQSKGRREAAFVRDLTVIISQEVNGEVIELARTTRAGDALIADGSADWTVSLEAIDAAGQYRVDVAGDYIDETGAVLSGRPIKLHVHLG